MEGHTSHLRSERWESLPSLVGAGRSGLESEDSYTCCNFVQDCGCSQIVTPSLNCIGPEHIGISENGSAIDQASSHSLPSIDRSISLSRPAERLLALDSRRPLRHITSGSLPREHHPCRSLSLVAPQCFQLQMRRRLSRLGKAAKKLQCQIVRHRYHHRTVPHRSASSRHHHPHNNHKYCTPYTLEQRSMAAVFRRSRRCDTRGSTPAVVQC